MVEVRRSRFEEVVRSFRPLGGVFGPPDRRKSIRDETAPDGPGQESAGTSFERIPPILGPLSPRGHFGDALLPCVTCMSVIM